LYCSTQCRCRSGAAMQNLSHSDSLMISVVHFTPPHFGTKHLVTPCATLNDI
jgi:hypothetical protein